MALTVTETATEADEITACAYCPELIDLNNGEGFRDSNGDDCCADCYWSGTAYIEPLDRELDSGAGW